ncbi:MAG TPA: type II toxin-antitoxin system ParD family antitoxin [Aurantimonas sp.]|uniref:Type II toxin-antitoxin system ParD family antitoxin n=1 Tax=Aurantimonas marianensis TaxID=2920428 RepID=A0A9X2HCX1_9HYPH|nr:type II toxin-antitoxin system ParD family antitoxin [Aurantimonas marianensis]MCP3056162.1 type II toxin-antitoxin system ParD family antitoxin [Aurantimonas marianensis]
MPDAMKDWIESRIKDGEYASTSEHVRDLVRRDWERRGHPELTLDDLRRIVTEARAGGISDRSISDIKAEALKVARARDLVTE